MSRRILLAGLAVAGALLVLVFALSLSRSVPPGQTPGAPRTSAPGATPSPILEQLPCERPYATSSIWNVPIDWSIARVHPLSDSMMRAFFKTENWIGTETSKYAPNVYYATNATPLVPVRLREHRFRDALNDQALQFGEPAGIVWMPLPPDARPAAGSDGQLVVINLDTGEEWGLNKGSVDGAGNWLAGGVYRYHVENSGIPPEGFGQRGAGIGQLAGIVRRCEVERGRIDHAVTLAYNYPCRPEVCQWNDWPAFIPPFRKTDGRGDSQFDIPEGARMAVRPNITEAEFARVCDGVRGCVLWLLSMQQYGGFMVDNSDHPKTYAEGNATAHWDPSLWSRDMLRKIPPDWYMIIDWDHPSTRTN